MSKTINLTTAHASGVTAGDIVALNTGGGRWHRLLQLIKDPHYLVVASTSGTTMILEPRRMTVREWLAAAWAALLDR